MDSSMFMQFMSHVSDYFGVNTAGNGYSLEQVQYAEITGEDLNTVSAIFGGYSPDDNRILLVPVHPQRFILPIKNSFDVLISEKDCTELKTINLKAK
ncbi:MAG: hypothetical protein NTY32_08710 [Bacteroidia bacterium]|nr:hypothetical protein [Bacteroidia bacterium]